MCFIELGARGGVAVDGNMLTSDPDIYAGLTVFDLEELELAYAPPYGSAKDPVNMAGFVGANLLNGDVDFWYPEDFPEKTGAGIILDVRTNVEFRDGRIAGAVHIPLHDLRARLGELSPWRDKPVFTYCLTGIRSYYALRILRLNGFSEVYNLSGSWKTWNSYYRTTLEDGTVTVLNTENDHTTRSGNNDCHSSADNDCHSGRSEETAF